MIKLIWKGETAPTENKEKYLWDDHGVLKYWNGSYWVETSEIEGKIDSAMLPDNVVTTDNIESLVRQYVHDGTDGKTLYTWIKYADDDHGTGMSDFPVVSGVRKPYMGVAYNQETREKSSNPADYAWSPIVGSDGQDGNDGINGIDGDPGLTIRTTVWEAGKQYYDGTEIINNSRYLDIVADKEMGTGVGIDPDTDPDDKVHYYTCIRQHVSSNERTYEDSEFWESIVDLGVPIKTPLLLAEKISAEYIDVDSLVAKKVTVTDTNDNVVAKIGDMQDYVVDSETKKYPFWIGGNVPSTAVTRIDSNGELITQNIHAKGSFESTEVAEEFTGSVKMTGGSLTYNIQGNGYGGTAIIGYRSSDDKALISAYATHDDPAIYAEHEYSNATAIQIGRGRLTIGRWADGQQQESSIRLLGNSYIEAQDGATYKHFVTPVFRTYSSSELQLDAYEHHTVFVYASRVILLPDNPDVGTEFDIFICSPNTCTLLSDDPAMYVYNGTRTDYNSGDTILLYKDHHYKILAEGTRWVITE